ncbi:di-heme oxidoredictase family protein [uncultured Metabacillus sp.]|uniref:di-heme oxidoredictase family protein n=1 Tax=uncultured Metabacillus sp. TaxID=2860135 RepID=UPI0026116234|nr:di-heme oxidoredictase family protein [uncultured Metabacillus sp.]
MGTLLQRAASKKYRYDINSGIKPSEFFAQVDPTPNAPGVNRLIKAPTFPKISYMTSIGLFSSSDNYKAWEQVNAMSAYMNTLAPPATELKKDKATFEKGRSVFAKAGCISCHGGTYLTNNQLISTEEIKTDSSRAKGFHVTEHYFTKPEIFAPNTPVPLPKHPETIAVEMNDKEKQSLKKAWAHGNSSGVYKTPSLYGLYWSAPYLHDGGVAVGPSLELGIPNTLFKGIHPDPVNSLKALLDSKLRQKVIKANLENDQLSSAHVSGKGHDFYIDVTTGFTK